MYSLVKLVHISSAVLSVSGFTLRVFWMLTDSVLLTHRVTRIAPHVVDSVLLLSGIGLVWILRLQVSAQPWLLVKLPAVLLYILLGMIALRRGRTRRARASAYVLALATFCYIAGVALSKSVLSWLALV